MTSPNLMVSHAIENTHESWYLNFNAGKEYTLILKDEVLPRNPENGRERATISWEHDFRVSPEIPSGLRGFAAWSDFKPTYRGKEVKDAKPLRTKSIIRVGLMQRR